MTEKLKPCPFCASQNVEPVEVTYPVEITHYAYGYCNDCGTQGPIVDTDAFPKTGLDRAINLWNQRMGEKL